jgi:hypothetical protein
VFAQPIHESGEQPISRQGRGTVRHQSDGLSLVLFGQAVDSLSQLIASRLWREIHTGRQSDSSGTDEQRDDRFIGMKTDHVGDDGEKLVWPADFELSLWQPAASPLC